MSAIQWPDGSIEIQAAVDIPCAVVAQGSAAMLAFAAKALFEAADKSLDAIEESEWPRHSLPGLQRRRTPKGIG